MKQKRKPTRKRRQAKPVQLFAFWRYDHFPYVLGGPVTAKHRDGTVSVSTYPNEHFQPFKLVELNIGLDIQSRLANLAYQRRDELLKLDEKFNALRDELIDLSGGEDRKPAGPTLPPGSVTTAQPPPVIPTVLRGKMVEFKPMDAGVYCKACCNVGCPICSP